MTPTDLLRRLTSRLSIRGKLMLITMVTCSITLLIVAGTLASIERQSAREDRKAQLGTLADVIAQSAVAALTFDDADAAAEGLSTLVKKPSIVSACIYGADGMPFATWSRAEDSPGDWPASIREFDDDDPSNAMHVARSIRGQDGTGQLGSIYIRSTTIDLDQRLATFTKITALVLALAMVVALGLSAGLQWLIANPIIALGDVARRVARGEDYSLRVSVEGGDEVARLSRDFNEMISQIEQRDDKITAHRDELEEIVRRRTEELSHTNASLVSERDRAEAGSMAKSEFLANMSHEIRTPLNGVMGMIELTRSTTLTDEQEDCLQIAYGSAESLLSIINDILDFSKIEAGRLEMDPVEFELRPCLDQTLRALAIRAHGKNLELVCDVRPDVPDSLIGDPGRLRQVMTNLIGNAIKFTEAGEVVARVDLNRTSTGGVELHFQVRDTGIGIAEEKLASIFDAFSQADNSTTRRFGGTGLGLTISRRLVEMMGGRIWAESREGAGTTFHFTVEMGVQEHAATGPAVDVDISGRRVLIVDDNATNRRILHEFVRAWGMAPQDVADAEAAVVALQHHSGFDLIILDGHMPVTDGFMLAERIRSEKLAPDVAMIMLTSGAANGDAERCRELGIAAYINKPISQSALLEVVQKVSGAGNTWGSKLRTVVSAAAVAETPALVAAAPPLRILLAEDHAVNQKLALALLRKRGHDVTLAQNGQEAVDAFRTATFDVVLMDVHMPVMGGLDATRAIREFEAGVGGRVPIIALTALAMAGDRQICIASGMDGYVSKPITAADLFDAIAELCAPRELPTVPLERGGNTAVQSVAGAMKDSDQPPTQPEIVSMKPPIDMNLLLAQVEGDLETACLMAEALEECQAREIAAIYESVERGDASLLKQSAHTMKGALLSLAANPAAEAARTLEEIGRSGSLEGSREALDLFQAEIDRLAPAIRGLVNKAA